MAASPRISDRKEESAKRFPCSACAGILLWRHKRALLYSRAETKKEGPA